MRDSATSSACLRRSADGVSFVPATQALDIPDRCAQRCKLLEDLATLNDCTGDDLPLPLSMSEVEAWLTCAELVKTAADPGISPLAPEGYMLINALKVRIMMLCDHSSM